MFLRRVVALARSPCIRRCNTNAAKSARTVPKRDIAASSQTKLPKKTIGLVLLGGLGAAIYSGDILPDAIQNPINEGIAAITERVTGMTESITQSDNEKLLPDMPPVPLGHMPRPTLVIDLEECLISREWNKRYGWRTVKRPGADKFLVHLAQFFEIVVFTTKPFAMAEPIMARLDPLGAVTHTLYRDSMTWKDGTLVKDLSRLNRDLAKVIVIDDDKDCLQMQPENGIIIAPFGGSEDQDRILLDLIPFLEELGMRPVKDVRTVLKHFDNDAKKMAKNGLMMKKRADSRRRRREQTGLGGMLRRSNSARPNQAKPKPKPKPQPQRRPTPVPILQPTARAVLPPKQVPGVGVWRQEPTYVKVMEPSTTEPRQTLWERLTKYNKESAKEMQAQQKLLQEAMMKQQLEARAKAGGGQPNV